MEDEKAMPLRNSYELLLKLLWTSTIMVIIAVGGARADVITHASVSVSGDSWTYTLFNDEPAGSNNWLSTFTLYLNSPIAVTATPSGWDFSSDGVSFVSWFNIDLDPPFPHDIAPGASLAGFAISAPNSISQPGTYDLISWDHTLDLPGPAGSGTVLVPVSVEVGSVPEPSSASLLVSAIAGLFAIRRLRLALKS
jgi:hypothetical protein